MRILIVGAGVMGLAAAWACARRGHEIAVLEQGPIPNPAASSTDHHRIIRYAYRQAAYGRMVDEAYAAWDRLWDDIDAWHYVETGCFAACFAADDWTDATTAVLDEIGQPYRKLSTEEATAAYPYLALDGALWACETDHGGILQAERILNALTVWAHQHDVQLLPNVPVQAISPDRASVSLASGGELNADAVILAAGPWAGRLLPALAPRLTPSRQIAAYVEPPAPSKRHWQFAPVMLDLDNEQGIYVVPPLGALPMKIGGHDLSLTTAVRFNFRSIGC